MNTATKVIIFLGLGLLMIGCKSEVKEDPSQIMKTGNPEIDQLSQKILQSPDDKTLYFARAQAFHNNEGYDEAIKDLGSILKIDSLDITALHLLSDVYMDYLQSRNALATMEHAAKLYPKRIPTLLKLSETYYILTKHQESMGVIDQILQIDPQNAEAYFMFGQNFKDLGDSIRSINSYQKAVEFEPDLVDGWVNLGQQYAKISPRLALEYFNTAININPKNILPIHAKADFYRNQNLLNEAIALYKQTISIDPQYQEGSYNAGLLYMALDSIPQAKNMFNLCIQVAPTHVQAYFYRGYAYELLGNIKSAKNDFEQALNFSPDFDLAKEGLARVIKQLPQ